MAVNRESTIQIMYSATGGVQPTPTDLEYGELAINIADGKVYFRGDDDSLKTFEGATPIGYTAGNTAPSGSNTGDFWLETDTGLYYAYVWDGSTLGWLQLSGPRGATGATGAVGATGATGNDGTSVGYTAGNTAPVGMGTGDFWYENDTGLYYAYVWDGSTLAWLQISGQDGADGVDGATGATGPTGPVGDYVETFNGSTGAVEGVSSVNGATGDVDTPRYYTMNMPLGYTGGVIPTGMVTHSVQHVPESLELVACQLYVPSGIVNTLNNFNVSVKKTTTLSDSTANITSGATSVATVLVAGGGKAGANYYNTATLASPGPTAESGEWIFCDVTNNSDNETQAVVMLKWQIS